jgi:hypothetical protein
VDDLLTLLRLSALDFLGQVTALLGGLALLALALGLVERRISRRLSHRFGWRSVLVTGWLGVPVHELSHLVVARLFGHRIIAYSLFDPDPRTGTLGYVQHGYRRRNLYQLAGNFFIGVAPLVGGSAVLLAGLWLLLPGARVSLAAAPAGGVDAQLLHTAALAGHTLQRIFTVDNVASWRLWVFLLLALCVGTHLSPSRPDLEGAWPGLALLLGGLFLLSLANRALGLWPPRQWALAAGGLLSPLLAALGIALALELALWAVVEAVVHLTTPRRGVSLGYENG